MAAGRFLCTALSYDKEPFAFTQSVPVDFVIILQLLHSYNIQAIFKCTFSIVLQKSEKTCVYIVVCM